MELRPTRDGVDVAVGHGDSFVLYDGSFLRWSMGGSLLTRVLVILLKMRQVKKAANQEASRTPPRALSLAVSNQ